jgi:hypothetical protein
MRMTMGSKKNEIMAKSQCRYCGDAYEQGKKGEHVFPKGLGGEDIYMQCVCQKCNGEFSALERELIQLSPVGLMRSVEGVEGYKGKGPRQSPFKAQMLLMADVSKKYIYEVSQYYPMQVDVRPQIVLFDGQLYLEGDTEEGVKTLSQKFNKWKSDSLIILALAHGESADEIVSTKVQIDENGIFATDIPYDKKMKGAIIVSYLESDHHLYHQLSPRLYLDDDLQLRIRARCKADAVRLMEEVIKAVNNKHSFRSYPTSIERHATVSVGFSFNSFKFEQAIVKIGLNCLLHYYPDVLNGNLIDDAISFVKTGSPLIHREVEKKSEITDSAENCHTIFFMQTEQSVHIRTGLFQGSVVFSFKIPGLKILSIGHYNRLVIDYKLKKHRLESQSDFLQSFHKKIENDTEAI